MKALRRALQNGPSPMPIRHSCRNLFKVFTAPTQRGRSIVWLLSYACLINEEEEEDEDEQCGKLHLVI